MKEQKAEEKKKVIQLEPIKIKNMRLDLQGTSPLLMNRFSEKKQQEIIDKQMKKTKQKEARNPQEEVKEKIHYDEDGNVSFPSAGFKKAMVESAPYLEGLDKKMARGSFFIKGQFVPIKYSKMVVNQATVRLSGMGRVASIAFRPEFRDWSCVLVIDYNSSQISPEQIVNLANLAGFHIGVGEWTPQHSGNFGMFAIKGK